MNAAIELMRGARNLGSAVKRAAGADWLTLRARFDGNLRCNADVNWLFLFTFPNGGSTALAELLGSSRNARGLRPAYEGAWLVPELTHRDRNLERPLVSAKRLRAIWLGHLPRESGAPLVVIEKSPSNKFRWRHISNTFSDMPQTRVVLTRAPLPTIASWIGRYGIDRAAKIAGGTFGIPAHGRHNLLRIWARQWLYHGETLLEIMPHAHLTIAYADLCANPTRFLADLTALIPLLADVDPAAPLKVKDYPLQPLRNVDESNLLLLDNDDRETIRSELVVQAGLVRALGYEV